MATDKESILTRAISIVACVSQSNTRLTPAELADKLKLPKPTVYRIINQLLNLGVLKKELQGKGLLPGDHLQHIAMQVISSTVNNVPRHSILQTLSEEVGETCNITFLDGNKIVYLDRVETDWPIRVQLPLGSRVPLHCTASGKLFLANMNSRLRKSLIKNLNLKRYTEKTIVDVDELEEEVLHIKQTGIGTDEEEFIKGMIAIAVPVIDKDDKIIFTIAVHAPTVRQTVDELRQYIPALRRSAAAIGKLYNYE